MKTRYFLEEEAGSETGAGAAAANTGAADGEQGAPQTGDADGKGAGTADQQKIEWPADWRQRLASENKDALKTLERFADPSGLWKSYEAMRQKVSSGELKASAPFPEKGTPEEQNAWRKERGIPEKADAYDLKLANGVVVGDEDKPLVEDFLSFAHAHHTPGETVKKTLEWFLGDYREKAEARYAEAEAEQIRKAEDTLRNDWGADYRANMNAIENLLAAHVPTESTLKERILKSLKLEPDFAKLWATLARQINPVSTLTGIDPARQEQSINDEIAKIEELMKAPKGSQDADRYWKDNAVQARYRELLAARERMVSRQRAT